jgi:hypothetical protein
MTEPETRTRVLASSLLAAPLQRTGAQETPPVEQASEIAQPCRSSHSFPKLRLEVLGGDVAAGAENELHIVEIRPARHLASSSPTDTDDESLISHTAGTCSRSCSATSVSSQSSSGGEDDSTSPVSSAERGDGSGDTTHLSISAQTNQREDVDERQHRHSEECGEEHDSEGAAESNTGARARCSSSASCSTAEQRRREGRKRRVDVKASKKKQRSGGEGGEVAGGNAATTSSTLPLPLPAAEACEGKKRRSTKKRRGKKDSKHRSTKERTGRKRRPKSATDADKDKEEKDRDQNANTDQNKEKGTDTNKEKDSSKEEKDVGAFVRVGARVRLASTNLRQETSGSLRAEVDRQHADATVTDTYKLLQKHAADLVLMPSPRGMRVLPSSDCLPEGGARLGRQQERPAFMHRGTGSLEASVSPSASESEHSSDEYTAELGRLVSTRSDPGLLALVANAFTPTAEQRMLNARNTSASDLLEREGAKTARFHREQDAGQHPALQRFSAPHITLPLRHSDNLTSMESFMHSSPTTPPQRGGKKKKNTSLRKVQDRQQQLKISIQVGRCAVGFVVAECSTFSPRTVALCTSLFHSMW